MTRQKKSWQDKSLLGKTFVDRQHEVILQIGKDTWSREEVTEKLKIGNPGCVRIISRVAKYLDVKSVADMARRVSLDDLYSIYGVGITTIFVWMKILDGMEYDPIEWLDQEVAVTLSTEKKRVEKALAEQKVRKVNLGDVK